MSKFYKRILSPDRPDDPTITSAAGFWDIREQRLAKASGTWPDGIIPIINYLAIGGGGSGGNSTGGGTTSAGGAGGGGGLVVGSFGPTYKQPGSIYGYTLTITVGVGGQPNPTPADSGNSGGNSTISGEFFNTLGTLTAYGGGFGGGGRQFYNGTDGSAGGSGGGQGGYSTGSNPIVAAAATQPSSTYGGYGNNGGKSSTLGGAGGGGAGGLPGVGSGGAGGAGLYVNVANNSSYSAIFGRGGTQATNRLIVAGTAQGYGSGGNGGFDDSGNLSNRGGPGADGVAIFWYSSDYPKPALISGTYTTTKENGYRIYKFTSSGSIKF
jgi:hypothetical protein